jgi:hypothetical protein
MSREDLIKDEREALVLCWGCIVVFIYPFPEKDPRVFSFNLRVEPQDYPVYRND